MFSRLKAKAQARDALLRAGVATDRLQAAIRKRRRRGLTRGLAVILAIAAFMSGMATYLAMTAASPVNQSTRVYWLLILDLILILLLGVVVARRIAAVLSGGRRKLAGARLEGRLVTLFSLMAVVPTIITTVCSAVFLYYSIESWFGERVRTVVEESRAVARAYLEEHQYSLKGDALAMANDINREAARLIGNPDIFTQLIRTQALLRNFTEAMVFQADGYVLARTGSSFGLELEPASPDMLQRAMNEDVVLLISDEEDRVRGLVHLGGLADAYLMVGRPVESRVLGHMEATQAAAEEYGLLVARRASLQYGFIGVLVAAALVMLLAAIWLALMVSRGLVEPLRRLIEATDNMRAGDLTVRVDEELRDDELSDLTRAFNRMGTQLDQQRQTLMEMNSQLDTRRRFTEAVLEGVSTGVLRLDADKRVILANRAAGMILEKDITAMNGQEIAILWPEIEGILVESTKNGQLDTIRHEEKQISHTGQSGKKRELLVRLSIELPMLDDLDNNNEKNNPQQRYLITFEDVSSLLQAQRLAAWSDVARRLAHEIKNPLTPIQLAAERLQRRYLADITREPEIFKTCTDTIIRQVEDIGKLVDEFSSFARMPQAIFRQEQVGELLKQAVFLQRQAAADIIFTDSLPMGIKFTCDGRQLSRAVTNLLLNAVDSVRQRLLTQAEPQGRVDLLLQVDEHHASITITDNGTGFGQDNPKNFAEPYVTTRPKGSGLGLAIVKRIMEDHKGQLEMKNNPAGGASVTLVFPLQQEK
ncbi:MAG: ATP-binding protein [Alphaproteobacteria bacterium]